MIPNRVSVCRVEFAGAQNFTAQWWLCSRGGECVEERGDAPVVVSVGGWGVLRKGEEVWGRDGFVCTRHGAEVAIVRQEQLAVLGGELTGAQIVEIRCGDENAAATAQAYFEHTNWHTLLKRTPEGVALARWFSRKLRMPVLGLALAALVINFFVARGVQSRHDSAAAELAALRTNAGQADRAKQRRQEISLVPPIHAAAVFDRAGAAVPEGVTLVSMNIQPLIHSLGDNRKVEVAAGVMCIAGRAAAISQVTSYVDALKNSRLTSIEQAENGFNFAIEMAL